MFKHPFLLLLFACVLVTGCKRSKSPEEAAAEAIVVNADREMKNVLKGVIPDVNSEAYKVP